MIGYTDETELVEADSVIISVSQDPRQKLIRTTVGLEGSKNGLLLVDENADELLASEVRQAVKDQLADNFIYASVSPTYLAGVIDTL